MNLDVFLLFFNALLSMLLVAALVVWIVRREYLPVIRKLESEDPSKDDSSQDAGRYEKWKEDE